MHSQKNSEIGRDLTKTRCALATATCLQHPERLARPYRAHSGLLPLRCEGDAITTTSPDQAEALLAGAGRSEGMSARVGTGLLRDFIMMLGGAVGIGLPMAVVIIWVCS
jgi:hypothetical protein